MTVYDLMAFLARQTSGSEVFVCDTNDENASIDDARVDEDGVIVLDCNSVAVCYEE